jgi:hypothetical protein
LFGLNRLDAAAAHPCERAQAVIERVLSAVETFTAGGAFTDDRTLLALVLCDEAASARP